MGAEGPSPGRRPPLPREQAPGPALNLFVQEEDGAVLLRPPGLDVLGGPGRAAGGLRQPAGRPPPQACGSGLRWDGHPEGQLLGLLTQNLNRVAGL